ncbi:hypothetical protein ACFL6U_06740 [Planctomycetota bacterium]
MRRLQNLCLAVFLLGVVGVSDAGQKVVIRYDQNDAMQAFGVGDLKKALEGTGNKIVDDNVKQELETVKNETPSEENRRKAMPSRVNRELKSSVSK